VPAMAQTNDNSVTKDVAIAQKTDKDKKGKKGKEKKAKGETAGPVAPESGGVTPPDATLLAVGAGVVIAGAWLIARRITE
jgi:hypothetical protein